MSDYETMRAMLDRASIKYDYGESKISYDYGRSKIESTKTLFVGGPAGLEPYAIFSFTAEGKLTEVAVDE